MDDFEKLKILTTIEENFGTLPEDIEQFFLSKINIENIDVVRPRLKRGMGHEALFYKIFGVLPFVKLLHELHEKQAPEISKKEFQVPDYLGILKTLDNNEQTVVFDVKGVKEEKTTLKNIMSKQVINCQKYAKSINAELLYPIYWSKIKVFTLNSIDHFIKKGKTYKIEIGDAFVNDLSIIMGDFVYFIPKTIYRKSTYNKNNKDENRIKNKIYGDLEKEHINNGKIIDLTNVESIILDKCFQFKEMNKIEKDDFTIVTYQLDNNSSAKLSTHIGSLINNIQDEIELNEKLIIFLVYHLYELLNKITDKRINMFPKRMTTQSQKLFQNTFNGTGLYDKYRSMP